MSGTGSGERILAILDLFSEARPEWRPEAMMEALGYSRPTLYRYLKTLRAAGLVVSLPGAGLVLGPRVTELDFLMHRSDPLILHGQPELERLAAGHPCSALLVRWYARKLLCVASVVSAPEPRSSYPRGRPMPLARGAISRAILAFLPRRTLEPLIRENLAAFAAQGAGESVDDLLDTMRQVRRDGHAVAYGEVTPGVVGIAVPIFEASRAPVAALCVTSDAALITPARLSRIAGDLHAGADRVSAAMAAAQTDTPRIRETAGPAPRASAQRDEDRHAQDRRLQPHLAEAVLPGPDRPRRRDDRHHPPLRRGADDDRS